MDPEAAYQARVGKMIGGKYRVLRMIAAGGMGAVYEAENAWIKRRVAIKVLRPELLRNQEAVQRFTQEAQAATQIDHPNIVFVMDMGQEPIDGSLYIVEEFLTGMDLRRRLASEKRLSLEEALGTMLPIMSALVAAHERGIVHRDVKPENIFLVHGSAGEVTPKLIDFGVSKIMDTAGALAKTNSGEALGTPCYMSPEQARGDASIDARTDVWSVGAVLFELLAGQPPFDASNFHLLAMKILTEHPPPLESVAPGVPIDIASIVNSALEPDRERRFRSMRAFREAIKHFAASRADLAAFATVTAAHAPIRVDALPNPTPVTPHVPAVPIEVTVPTLSAPAPLFIPKVPALGGTALGQTATVSAPARQTAVGPTPSAPMHPTALGWTEPAAPARGAPWILFMVLAAVSVFVGAASVVIIRGRPAARSAVSATRPNVTRSGLVPRATPATDASAVLDASAPTRAATPAALPTDAGTVAPPVPVAPVAPATHPSRTVRVLRSAHAMPPIPPPRRIAPPTNDPQLQRASMVATQLSYSAQQTAPTDPRRATRMAQFATGIQSAVERIRSLELEATQYDTIDPNAATRLRASAVRERQRLQQMIQRAPRQ